MHTRVYIGVGLFGIVMVSGMFFVVSKNIPIDSAYDTIGSMSAAEDLDIRVEVPFHNLFPGEDRYMQKDVVLPSSTYIVSMEPALYPDPMLLHHATIYYSGARGIYCFHGPEPILSVGSEFNAVDASDSPYGIFLKKGETISVYVHLLNDSTEMRDGVFYVVLHGKADRKPVVPVFLLIRDLCAVDAINNTYPIPRGASHHEITTQLPFKLPWDARVVFFIGHLHQYGTRMDLIKNNDTVHTLHPISNPDPSYDKKSVYLDHVLFKDPIQVSKGDVLDIRAIYDKPEDIFYKDAMGIGYVLLDVGEDVR